MRWRSSSNQLRTTRISGALPLEDCSEPADMHRRIHLAIRASDDEGARHHGRAPAPRAVFRRARCVVDYSPPPGVTSLEPSMRKTFLLFLAIVVLAASAYAGVPGRFAQYPDISGNIIVFTWERDLWTVPATGGVATRLTTYPGMENAAKISPDGKRIAFQGQ